MKFLNFLFFGIAFVGCVSATEDIETSSIKTSQTKQLKDLFGKTIIPEQVVESEYGLLKFNPVVMPDFSGNKEDLGFLNEHLDAIYKMVTTGDMSLTNGIAIDLIRTISQISHKNSGIYRLLRDIVLSVLCRSIESIEINPSLSPKSNSSLSPISVFKGNEILIMYNMGYNCFTSIISYNGFPVKDEDFCRAMVYLSSLDAACLHPDYSFVLHSYDEEYLNKTSLIKENSIPKTNLLSWALDKGNTDVDLLSFTSKYLARPYNNTQNLARDIIQGWRIKESRRREAMGAIIIREPSENRTFIHQKFSLELKNGNAYPFSKKNGNIPVPEVEAGMMVYYKNQIFTRADYSSKFKKGKASAFDHLKGPGTIPALARTFLGEYSQESLKELNEICEKWKLAKKP